MKRRKLEEKIVRIDNDDNEDNEDAGADIQVPTQIRHRHHRQVQVRHHLHRVQVHRHQVIVQDIVVAIDVQIVFISLVLRVPQAPQVFQE